MSVYVIADLHLSFGEEDKPMDVFGGAWVGYMDRIQENWLDTVKPEDTVVIPGDISWAMGLKESLADLTVLNSLPGNKIILKGNHDYWWDTLKKMQNFLEENELNTIKVLFNNAFYADGVIICGSRLWDSVGSSSDSADRKTYLREVGRLRMSLDAGLKLREQVGEDTPIAVFAHYPPVATFDGKQEFMKVMQDYGVAKCYYGHLHGAGIQVATQGDVGGVELKLISADALGFVPWLVNRLVSEPLR